MDATSSWEPSTPIALGGLGVSAYLAQQNHFRLCFRGHLPILRIYIFLNSSNSYLKTMVHPALPLRLRGWTMSVPDCRYRWLKYPSGCSFRPTVETVNDQMIRLHVQINVHLYSIILQSYSCKKNYPISFIQIKK